MVLSVLRCLLITPNKARRELIPAEGGVKMKKEYSVALATRIPVSLMAALDKAAADSGRSKAEIIVEALTKHLKGAK